MAPSKAVNRHRPARSPRTSLAWPVSAKPSRDRRGPCLGATWGFPRPQMLPRRSIKTPDATAARERDKSLWTGRIKHILVRYQSQDCGARVACVASPDKDSGWLEGESVHILRTWHKPTMSSTPRRGAWGVAAISPRENSSRWPQPSAPAVTYHLRTARFPLISSTPCGKACDGMKMISCRTLTTATSCAWPITGQLGRLSLGQALSDSCTGYPVTHSQPRRMCPPESSPQSGSQEIVECTISLVP